MQSLISHSKLEKEIERKLIFNSFNILTFHVFKKNSNNCRYIGCKSNTNSDIEQFWYSANSKYSKHPTRQSKQRWWWVGDISDPCIQACNGFWWPSHSAGIYWFNNIYILFIKFKLIFYIKFIPHLQTNVLDILCPDILAGKFSFLYLSEWIWVEKGCCTKGLLVVANKTSDSKMWERHIGRFLPPAGQPSRYFISSTNSLLQIFPFFSCKTVSEAALLLL